MKKAWVPFLWSIEVQMSARAALTANLRKSYSLAPSSSDVNCRRLTPVSATDYICTHPHKKQESNSIVLSYTLAVTSPSETHSQVSSLGDANAQPLACCSARTALPCPPRPSVVHLRVKASTRIGITWFGPQT